MSELDIDGIISVGDFVRGLLPLYLALLQPDKIWETTVSYPMINQDPPFLRPSVPNQDLPHFSQSIGLDYMKNIKPGQVTSSEMSSQRAELSGSIMRNFKINDYFLRRRQNQMMQNR
jgi:hypothetical protein